MGMHTSTCRRPEHSGPCDGVLRVDGPETPAEAHERRREAVEAVLLRAGVNPFSRSVRAVAEECLAAADAGF